MAAAEVDLGYLATNAGIPELDLNTAVTAPTAELVTSVLQAVLAKLRDLEQEKFQLNIELEGAIRGSESRCEQFKATADKALKDVEELRQKLQNEESTRRAIENEFQALKSSGTTSQSEIETLRARIASLETSNRETLAIVDSKTTANATLAEELQKQHQKILKLNSEISSLNQSVQSAQTAANSAKYREEALKQELELAKKNNEWYDAELKTKAAESLKFRKEKGARVAELQRMNEDANSTIESLTRSEQQLRKRLDEAQSKAEEALSKVQQLSESNSRAEESFRQEIESQKRLADLKDQQSETHRKRNKELEERLEQLVEGHTDEMRRVRRELEQAKNDLAQAEEQIQSLQAEVDRLRVSVVEAENAPAEAPQTPRANGSFLIRPGSPFGTPLSVRGKRSTDTLEELLKVKAQLTTEQRKNQKLQEDLDECLAMLEAKAPEYDEAVAQNEELKADLEKYTELSQQAWETAEAAKKAQRKAEAAVASIQAENKIFRAQVRDLGTQVHVLVFNAHVQEKGMDMLTSEEHEQFQRMQRGEITENALEDMSDTHRFITERFVVFKDIVDLQQKNEELLRITRQLADQMEKEEAQAKARQEALELENPQQLHDTIRQLQDEIQTLLVKSKSYVQERDMFRRLLHQKADTAEIREALGVTGEAQREPLASIEQQAHGESDMAGALRELQRHYDSYRNDQAAETNSLKDQIQKLSSEKASLQSEISRISSQLTLATERYSILESNFKALQSEKQEIQKRNQSLSESAAKQDLRTQQVAEDLVEARGLVESLRSENANLKAEKTLWRSIQDRLTGDNETLAQEKTRLNGLLSSQQSLLNERELSESETKRRLQGQIDALDAELTTTKRKLSEEIDECRKIQQRKEFDAQQFQKRIDELTTTISQVKEDNIQVKTTRDHLQARVSELEIEVRNAQDRAERLRPLPTPRPGTMHDQGGVSGEAQERIDELENEVQDLKNQLDLVGVQLENAKQEAEHYKEHCKALEDDLTTIVETHEQFGAELEKDSAAKASTISELEQRVEALTLELGASNNELNMLRDSQADIARKSEEKERILSSEIARLKSEEEKYREIAKYHQQDLRTQQEITVKAQQEYEYELVKHAEAAKALQEIRTQFNELKIESGKWKAEAESAKLALRQSEQSWEERKVQLEQEITDIKARKDDAAAQNKLLHQQLDSVTSQIAALQQNRMADNAGDGSSGAIADTATEGLRELNNYLRREKEILEVQYDIKLQEAKRLQQQLDYSQSQLDEARLKLEQERRSNSESSRNSITHKELMDKLNELNLIRESNVTLRNENQRTQAQLDRKSKKIEELEAKIQPLEARISELDFDRNFKEQEIKQLQEARDSLQKRIESILSKYGQADPHEVEQLKVTIMELETERDSLRASEQSLQAKVKEAEETLETKANEWNSLKAKFAEDFKTRYKAMKTQRDEAITEKGALQGTIDRLNARLVGVEQELTAARQDLASLTENNKELEQNAAAPAPAPTPVSVFSQPTANGDNSELVAQLNQQLESLKSNLEIVTAEKAAADAQIEQLKAELADAIAERDQARAAQQAAASGDVTMEEGDAASVQPAVAGLTDEQRKALEERIAAAEAKAAEFEKKAKELEEQADVIVRNRSEKMKTALNKKLQESKENLEKQAQEDKAKLEAEYQLKLQQEIAIAKAEQLTSAPPQNGVPSTPAKPAGEQPPATPTVGTPGLDINNISESQVRSLLANNPVVAGIVKSNVKKLADKAKEATEIALKAEYEVKIATAKDQASALTEKKSALRLNMLDRQHKTAQAKIQIVETAAKETPQRPVGEVWEIAKDAKPPAPAPTPAPAAAPATAQAAPSAIPTEETRPKLPAAQAGAPQLAKPAPTNIPAPGSAIPAPGAAKPAGAPAQSNLPAVNPFGQPTPAAQGQAQHFQPQQQIPPPVVRTGIPQPRGGATAGRGGRGGVYQAPGRGGPGGHRGRGGFQGRGGAAAAANAGANLNPGAGEFNPNPSAGNKRPRNDSEVGSGERGGKRPRGGGNVGGGAAAGGQVQQ
ncbi:putative nucleo protein TPR [Triangularia verruculosa]|uniref:Nucleo protein TPR n=1 Tax=Triangularia verruculosa TaxID=2587418 RepID=A0AAN7AVP5_9PEZI|nr:putative nucleo protein TPR [Triangularia verruculosa]